MCLPSEKNGTETGVAQTSTSWLAWQRLHVLHARCSVVRLSNQGARVLLGQVAQGKRLCDGRSAAANRHSEIAHIAKSVKQGSARKFVCEQALQQVEPRRAEPRSLDVIFLEAKWRLANASH